MKAILIGSRAYKETDYGDTDIIADREWMAANMGVPIDARRAEG